MLTKTSYKIFEMHFFVCIVDYANMEIYFITLFNCYYLFIQDRCHPVMTAYKLVTVDAPYWGFGYRLEQALLAVKSLIHLKRNSYASFLTGYGGKNLSTRVFFFSFSFFSSFVSLEYDIESFYCCTNASDLQVNKFSGSSQASTERLSVQLEINYQYLLVKILSSSTMFLFHIHANDLMTKETNVIQCTVGPS